MHDLDTGAEGGALELREVHDLDTGAEGGA